MTSIWVYTSENHGSSIEVPLTPETKVTDVLDCVRDPVRGDGYLVAVAGDTEYILQNGDNAFSFLHQIWTSSGLPLTFLLRYYNQDIVWPPSDLEARRHQMRRPQNGQDTTSSPAVGKLPGGPGDLTLAELQEMASRQQQQMETQQQVLVAKEQRLKYLKQQEARHAQLASESERLRRIRERVESQELKLKKLRALRGQAEQHRANNNHLNSELDSVKAVFNEKEKELALAVAKVEQLTHQLKELRNGTIISMLSGKKQSAATLELEKLKKELLIRNKLNEEQNKSIAAKENVLRQQKDKVINMDNRIQELQQRLKKRKLQEDQNNQAAKQANKSNAKQTKGDIQTDIKSNEVKGMFGTDPYIQYAPQDVAKDDSYTRAGSFTKHDPKYQTLPSNVKLTQPPKSSSGTTTTLRMQQNEMNNNNESLEEYKLPTVLPINPAAYAPNSNNNQKIHPQQPSKTPRFNNNDFSKPNQNFVPQPTLRQTQIDKSHIPYNTPRDSFPTHSGGPVDHRKVPVSVPKPLPTRPDHSVPPSHPVISINEEERQAGSGQSSPASSEGSNSSGGIQIKGDNEDGINTASIGSVSAMIEKLNKARNNTQTVNENSHGANLPPTQFGANHSSDRSRFSNKTGTEIHNVPNISSDKPSTHPQPENQGVNSSSSNQDSSLGQAQVRPSDSSVFNGLPVSSSQANQASTSNGSHPPTQAPHLNLKPATTYRYASKNQIANTYMGRLGGAAMERYQQNLNKLYKNMDSSQKEAKANSSESADGASKVNQISPTNETETSAPSQEHFASVGSHDYPDIASDKGSYKLNTPKQVRRRHSDSENEEMNKALQDRHTHEQQMQLEENTTNFTTSDETIQHEEGKSSPSSQSNSVNNEKNNQANGEEAKEKVPDSTSPTDVKSETEKPAFPSPSSPVEVVRRTKSNLKRENSRRSTNRVSFDPLALLLDASLEGELDLVKKVAVQVDDVSTPNDEGITALHNAICAGHFEIVKFLIEFGCDVNSPDSDGWTPLHCAASCNNLPMVRFLVEHGACVFATTISDQETAADKCEEEEDGYDGCSDYLYSTQEKLGITNNGDVYSVFDYVATNNDELSFDNGAKLTVLRKGDENEKEWWWAKIDEKEGYIPRNLLGLYPRVVQQPSEVSEC